MDWKQLFADLVYIAVNKDYAPDEVWENPEAFEKAYEEFFGRQIRIHE